MIHIYTLCIFVYTYTCACMISHIWLFIPWTVAHQAPLSMELSRQEYWSGLPFPSPGDFSDPGIEVMSLASPALAGGFLTTEPPGKLTYTCNSSLFVYMFLYIYMLPWWLSSKRSACSAGDVGPAISGSGRSPGERNGNPLQYSCLGNSMDWGACQTTIHGVTE